MNRFIQERVKADLGRKMVFITGPRQVGKTCMAKNIAALYKSPQYLNYDNLQDQRIIHEQSWSLKADLLVLDEIHKMKDWKKFLKGVYDGRQEQQAILVTGSARLDTFRQSGESLAGRYFHYRLHPFSVKELAGILRPEEALERLIRLGGFPEPFLSGSEVEAERWRRQYYTDLIREDILEFGRLHEIRVMRFLLEMLRERVGSPLSYASLAGDLKAAPNTIRRYIEILESLYIVFMVYPFHRNIARAIQKEPKLYFYDTGLVATDATRLENAVAVCLKKHVDFLSDTGGIETELCYLRTKEKKEIDFVLAENNKPRTLIEVKTTESTPAPVLSYFQKRIDGVQAIQLVQHLRQPQNAAGIQVVGAAEWLSELSA